MRIQSSNIVIWRNTAIAALFVLGASACGGRDADDTAPGTTANAPAAAAVTVTDVKLGKAVDANNRVTDETDDFAPGDMIYASVITNGSSPSATLHARWTFEDGQVVDSTTRTIAPQGEAATSFHIMRPGGFPEGDYKLTILLNGAEARTKDFEVDG
jgi:hypothetical protein